MSTRQRPSDVASAHSRQILTTAGREIRTARRLAGLSIGTAAAQAGISRSHFGRIERGEVRRPSFERVCRAARVVGLEPSLKFYPVGSPMRDKPSLKAMNRFEKLLGVPLRMLREVPVPQHRDLRAWDGRIGPVTEPASVECESHLEDIQALARRIALKQRDDSGAGVVILVLNRTEHNRRVMLEHREALRAQLPLDGAAIARELRAGRIPKASGIILV
jgi:transcriptional regulator with XRE-family HTH domain